MTTEILPTYSFILLVSLIWLMTVMALLRCISLNISTVSEKLSLSKLSVQRYDFEMRGDHFPLITGENFALGLTQMH